MHQERMEKLHTSSLRGHGGADHRTRVSTAPRPHGRVLWGVSQLRCDCLRWPLMAREGVGLRSTCKCCCCRRQAAAPKTSCFHRLGVSGAFHPKMCLLTALDSFCGDKRVNSAVMMFLVHWITQISKIKWLVQKIGSPNESPALHREVLLLSQTYTRLFTTSKYLMLFELSLLTKVHHGIFLPWLAALNAHIRLA